MSYDVSEIQKLISEYDIPETFNYFNQSGAEIIIKDQVNCGSCWSFSATSVLAYRYKKYYINISLSPKDDISFYNPFCESGNTILCPSICHDRYEFKKYYTQNAYMAENNYQKDFYDLVILIMDQLIIEGSIVGGFFIYGDFYDFGKNKEKCLKDIYTFDGYSDSHEAQGITITGYGLLNNKFYWLIQNSWGENWCDNGFMKNGNRTILWNCFF